MGNQSLVSNETRDRLRGLARPIALAMGRLGLTPNGITVIGFVGTAIGPPRPRPPSGGSPRASSTLLFGIFDMFDGPWRGRPARRRRSGRSSIRRSTGPARTSSWPASAYGAAVGRCTSVAGLAALAIAFASVVTYARAKAEVVGITRRRRHRAAAGAPRAPLDRPGRSRPLRRLSDRTARPRRCPRRVGEHVARASPLGLIAMLSAITVLQRILAVRRQLDQHERNSTAPGEDHTWPPANGRAARTAPTPTNTWAGAGRRGDGKIRVAIVGVGNCASSLVQGRYYYENANDDDFVPGLMHVNLGGYHVRDIEFVAAFDIDKNKVGKDLSEAIYTKPNNTYVFQQVPHIGVTVERGMTHDGLGKYLSQIIEKAPGPTADIVGILKERQVDVMVSYLPVGSEEATKWYVEQALARRRRLHQRDPGVHRP